MRKPTTRSSVPAVVLEDPKLMTASSASALMERKTIDKLQFAAAPRKPTKEQKRIGQELMRRMAAMESGAITTAGGTELIRNLHIYTHRQYVAGAEAIVGLAEQPGRSERVQQYVDRYTANQMDDLERHLRGTLEAGAYAIAQLAGRSFDLEKDTRSRWRRRIEGDEW